MVASMRASSSAMQPSLANRALGSAATAAGLSMTSFVRRMRSACLTHFQTLALDAPNFSIIAGRWVILKQCYANYEWLEVRAILMTDRTTGTFVAETARSPALGRRVSMMLAGAISIARWISARCERSIPHRVRAV
ncbi:hypothetical protein J1614_006227, partial [Plenodomus biglobosus]